MTECAVHSEQGCNTEVLMSIKFQFRWDRGVCLFLNLLKVRKMKGSVWRRQEGAGWEGEEGMDDTAPSCGQSWFLLPPVFKANPVVLK